MEKPKYNIGDKVWFARLRQEEKWDTCPDCCGQRAVTIVFGDGSSASIDCGRCYPGGIEASTGIVKRYEWSSDPVEGFILGVGKGQLQAEWTYQLESRHRYSAEESQLFQSKEDADVRAKELAEEQKKEELDRLQRRKHYDRKTWAWNASYHRKGIQNAQKDLEYHTKKLSVAKVKAKEDPNDKIDHGFKSQAYHAKWPNEHRDGLD